MREFQHPPIFQFCSNAVAQAMSSKLDKLADNSKTKIDWALRELREHGAVLGNPYVKGGERLFEVDGKKLTAQDVYKSVSAFPEWNDRLGVGTARIPRVSVGKA